MTTSLALMDCIYNTGCSVNYYTCQLYFYCHCMVRPALEMHIIHVCILYVRYYGTSIHTLQND